MANIARITQHSYSDSFINTRVAKALGDMANILDHVKNDENIDITNIITNVRSSPDMAAAWVMATITALDATDEQIRTCRNFASALLNFHNRVTGTK